MDHDDAQLIRFFEGRVLPQTPFRLSPREIITDMASFIAIQVGHLQSGMGAGSARDTLIRLKDRLYSLANPEA